MGKKIELSNDLKTKIVNSHNDRLGYKSISKKFEVPTATVQSIIKKFQSLHTTNNLIGRGRKRKLSTIVTRNIVRSVNANPTTTTKDILENLKSSGIKVSRQTLQITLHENGLKRRRPRKTPLHTKKHLTARLQFAKTHVNSPESFFSSIF